jgi:hypothetical protein
VSFEPDVVLVQLDDIQLRLEPGPGSANRPNGSTVMDERRASAQP